MKRKLIVNYRYHQIGVIEIREKPIPKPSYGEVVMKIALTTICATDVHIFRGEVPVTLGITLGHEPIGIIHEIGVGVIGEYNE